MSVEVYEDGGYIVVERTDLTGNVVYQREPTVKNPNLLVDIIDTTGNMDYKSKRTYFSKKDGYTLDEVESQKATVEKNMDSCQLCERKRQQDMISFKSELMAKVSEPKPEPQHERHKYGYVERQREAEAEMDEYLDGLNQKGLFNRLINRKTPLMDKLIGTKTD